MDDILKKIQTQSALIHKQRQKEAMEIIRKLNKEPDPASGDYSASDSEEEVSETKESEEESSESKESEEATSGSEASEEAEMSVTILTEEQYLKDTISVKKNAATDLLANLRRLQKKTEELNKRVTQMDAKSKMTDEEARKRKKEKNDRYEKEKNDILDEYYEDDEEEYEDAQRRLRHYRLMETEDIVLKGTNIFYIHIRFGNSELQQAKVTQDSNKYSLAVYGTYKGKEISVFKNNATIFIPK